jgi:predicted DNA-binding protein
MENEFQTNGHKKNHLLQIRLDIEQKKRLEALATASGFKSVSDYVRVNLLNPSVEMKLNSIIDLLQKNKSGEKNGKSK